MPASPLLAGADPQAPFLWSQGRTLTAGAFLQQVAAVSRRLPAASHALNLCEQRDNFLIAWCAAVCRGQTNLLPASRAPRIIAEVRTTYPDSHAMDDAGVRQALAAGPADDLAPAGAWPAPLIDPRQIVQTAFTSGSTGAPRAHEKSWGSLLRSCACNAARIRECLGGPHAGVPPWIVATVPPQHMYGAETTVLLPLMERMAVHAGRPLFPADVAAALAEVPPPRVLVTTPVHLRVLLASAQLLPQLAVMVSATAPLDAGLAAAAENAFGAPMLEMFGSTETCVIATRLTAREEAWRLYSGISVEPREDHALVSAPWFDRPTLLQDLVELRPAGMLILGRNADMVEIAGKRASLRELTRRLLDVPGVRDAVVFQPSVAEAERGAATATAAAAAATTATAATAAVAGVRRVAALVVAPGMSAQRIGSHLGRSIDPAFVPRPLVLVAALPRNELGKIERRALLQAAFPHFPD